MAEKNFNTRIVHKHDIEANWQLAVNFTPKQGELIVYDPDENFSYPRIKIGDGEKNVNDLPFITDNVEIGEGGEIIYKQPEEPENAPVGSLWVDLDEYAGGQLFKQPEEPSTATEGDLWVDTDEEDGGLPGLTNEDNGKILLAQNGQWEVSNNSWNDLNNKPIIYGNTLEWDGDTTGLESIQHEYGFYLYKVSNLVISEEELSNSNSFTECDSTGRIRLFYPSSLIKTDLGIGIGSVLFTDNGIYFGKDIDGSIPDVYVTSFTIPGRQDLPRRKLDEEMLPTYVRNLKEKEETYFDKISTGGNSLDWDGNIEDLSIDPLFNNLYKISDITPSYEDLQKGGAITFNNQGKFEKTMSFGSNNSHITIFSPRSDGLPGCELDFAPYVLFTTIEENDRGYEPGLYVIKYSDFYISNITLNDYTEFPKKVFKKEVLPQNFILPEVTSENEGQILRVVNGVWTLVDFPTS